MSKDCDYPKGYRLPDQDNEEVYYRVLKFGISGLVKGQIEKFQNGDISDLSKIHVQPGIFKGRRFLPEEERVEKGISVDWSNCTTSMQSKKKHGSEYPDSYFGVLAIKIVKINEIKYLDSFLYCQYDPIEDNIAHSLIMGFPTEDQRKTIQEIEFQELRQRMGNIAKWVELPSY